MKEKYLIKQQTDSNSKIDENIEEYSKNIEAIHC